MQLERTQPGWLSTRVRFLVIAVIILAVAGVTIPLLAHSRTTAQPSGSTKASPPALAMRSFAGYAGRPALPGASRLAVKAIASAGGVRLAVGSADGYPAIWRQAPGGSWTLVTTPDDLPAQSAPETLTTVTHGPAGWIAVGVPGPVAVLSPLASVLADEATDQPQRGGRRQSRKAGRARGCSALSGWASKL